MKPSDINQSSNVYITQNTITINNNNSNILNTPDVQISTVI